MVTPGGGGAGFSSFEEQPTSVPSTRNDATKSRAIAAQSQPIAWPRLGKEVLDDFFIPKCSRDRRRRVTCLFIPFASGHPLPVYPSHANRRLVFCQRRWLII